MDSLTAAQGQYSELERQRFPFLFLKLVSAQDRYSTCRPQPRCEILSQPACRVKANPLRGRFAALTRPAVCEEGCSTGLGAVWLGVCLGPCLPRAARLACSGGGRRSRPGAGPAVIPALLAVQRWVAWPVWQLERQAGELARQDLGERARAVR